jgi:hypothetical protein
MSEVREDDFRPRQPRSLRVEQDLGGRYVKRRFPQEGDEPNQERHRDNSTNESPLAPSKADYVAQIEGRLNLACVEYAGWRKSIEHLTDQTLRAQSRA